MVNGRWIIIFASYIAAVAAGGIAIVLLTDLSPMVVLAGIATVSSVVLLALATFSPYARFRTARLMLVAFAIYGFLIALFIFLNSVYEYPLFTYWFLLGGLGALFLVVRPLARKLRNELSAKKAPRDPS